MANLVPKVNNVGSLGTASKVWNKIHVSTTSFANSSITEDGGSIKLKSLPVLVEDALTVAGNLSLSAQSGSLNLNSQKIINLGTPTLAADAATKSYVDSVLQGLDVKDSVAIATTAALEACTYANGSSGVGATLTKNANGAFPQIEGQTLSTVGDRILVKNQAAAAQNGIYKLTTVGDGSNAWVLTRDTDADTSAKLNSGVFVFIEKGTTNADSGWVCTTDGAITIGTTALAFSQFSGAGQITAGNGLGKSGNTLSVNTDGNSIEIDSDSLRVKDGGITFDKLAPAAIITQAEGIGSNDNETSIPTSAAVKDYVDNNSSGGSTTLAGLTDTAITTPSSGHILIYDGTNSFDNVAMSGDATITSAGVLTIGADAIHHSMLNDDIISGLDDINANLVTTDEIIVSDGGTIKRTDLSRLSTMMAGAGLADTSGTLVLNIDGLSALGGTGLHQTEDHFVFSDNGTEKKITFSNLQDAIFADISGNATVAAGGAFTIANDLCRDGVDIKKIKVDNYYIN